MICPEYPYPKNKKSKDRKEGKIIRPTERATPGKQTFNPPALGLKGPHRTAKSNALVT